MLLDYKQYYKKPWSHKRDIDKWVFILNLANDLHTIYTMSRALGGCLYCLFDNEKEITIGIKGFNIP